MGLMRAAEKFDPDKGVRFARYAAYWIRARIRKFVMENRRMVKMGTSRTQRKLYWGLARERKQMFAEGLQPDAYTLAERLEVDVEEVKEMESLLGSSDLSLNEPRFDDSACTMMDTIPDLDADVEESVGRNERNGQIRKSLKELVSDLSDRETDILHHRLMTEKNKTLSELGEMHGVTRERIRQIETRLKDKLSHHFQARREDLYVEVHA